MKKTFLLLLLILCVSCSKKMEEISIAKITTIHYDTIEISSKNWKQILDIYHEIPFSTKKVKKTYKNKLSIHTKDQLILLSFSDNSCGKLEIEDKTYYSCHKSVEKLQKEIKKATDVYTNEDFFEFKLVENKDHLEDTDKVINLEESNQYLKLYFKESVTQFRIHKTDLLNNEYTDIDLLYSENRIPKGTILYIKKRMNYDYIRISFENKYHTNFSVIPMMDEEKQKLILKTKKDPL